MQLQPSETKDELWPTPASFAPSRHGPSSPAAPGQLHGTGEQSSSVLPSHSLPGPKESLAELLEGGGSKLGSGNGDEYGCSFRVAYKYTRLQS